MGETTGEPLKTMARVGIAGAGAIGLTLAARLSMAGHVITLVARGESLRATREKGVSLIDLEGDRRVPLNVVAAEELTVQDVLFLCPKSQDLPSLAAAVRHAISSETLLVPLVNGIPWWMLEKVLPQRPAGRETPALSGTLGTILPRRQVLGTVTMITSERLGPGVARTINPLKITLGALSDEQDVRAAALAAHLTAAGISTTITEHIYDAVWTKVLLNLCSNPLSVTAGVTLGELFGDSQLRDISQRMLEEAVAVARAWGADIRQDVAELLAIGGRMGAVKTSMLQDFERDAPLELGAICEAVMDLAEPYGIDMPTTRAITNLAAYLSREKRSRSNAIAPYLRRADAILAAET